MKNDKSTKVGSDLPTLDKIKALPKEEQKFLEGFLEDRNSFLARLLSSLLDPTQN